MGGYELLAELRRWRGLGRAMLECEPNDMAADAVTCLEAWRKDAADMLSRPLPRSIGIEGAMEARSAGSAGRTDMVPSWYFQTDPGADALPTAIALGGEERQPAVCDGKEQVAFEAWARSEGMSMDRHPLHWLFLDPRTSAARNAWREAIEYCARAAPHPDKEG